MEIADREGKDEKLKRKFKERRERRNMKEK